MELELLEAEKGWAKIQLTEADETVIYPLISALMKDKDVEEARYVQGHPTLDKPHILLKTRRVKPQTALARVSKEIAESFKKARKSFEKETE